MRTKEIGIFLASLDQAERNYLAQSQNISASIRNLIRETGATKEEVCSRFGITPKKYEAFVNGNFNYDIRKMAILNAWWIEVETDKLPSQAPVTVKKEEV